MDTITSPNIPCTASDSRALTPYCYSHYYRHDHSCRYFNARVSNLNYRSLLCQHILGEKERSVLGNDGHHFCLNHKIANSSVLGYPEYTTTTTGAKHPMPHRRAARF